MSKIIIDSILEGHSHLTHFGAKGQFRASLGIDPLQPIDDADTAYSTMPSGLLRPVASEKFSGTTIASAPLWLIPNPKDAFVYVLDANGSAYTIDATFSTVTALADGGSLSNGIGNGAEYYDNYIYYSKNTTVARYGPLNGTAAFDGDYWGTTLGKTALTNTAYPKTFKNSLQLPNHVLKRHSDGRMYIADVVGNLGTLHYIATTKTTVEGDTNNSSTANKVQVGYGLWPTAMESYGSDMAIAFIEMSGNNKRDMRAKLAFWDTTSSSVNKITWVEFPDELITSMKNVNGILYVASGNINARGFRMSRFAGGYSVEEIYVSAVGEPPLPGAIDGVLDQILIGNHTTIPESDGCVHGIVKGKIFNMMRATGGTSSTNVTAVLFADNEEMGFDSPIIGWTQAGEGSTSVSHGLDKQGTAYNNAPSVWWSPLYRIAKQFKIQKIRIPLTQALAANMTLTAKIYTDDGTGTTFTYTAITSTNFPTYPNNQNIRLRADANGVSPTGYNNFWLELKWTGSALLTVGLPIEITLEIIDN